MEGLCTLLYSVISEGAVDEVLSTEGADCVPFSTTTLHMYMLVICGAVIGVFATEWALGEIHYINMSTKLILKIIMLHKIYISPVITRTLDSDIILGCQ